MPSALYRSLVPAIGLLLLGAATILYCYYPNLYQQILTAYGIRPFRFPFLDADFIGRGVECWRDGVNVYIDNPCDVLHRPHSYSPLWLRATFIPSGGAWTPTIGLTLDAAFFLAIAVIARPTTATDTALLAACCVSTMVVFALERANVDVLLFIALAGAALAASGPMASRCFAYALILFAGLLKFYPLAVLALILRERPRIAVSIALAAAAALLLFVQHFQAELVAMSHNIPVGHPMSDLFGAGNLPNGVALLADPDMSDPSRLSVLLRCTTWIALLLTAVALASTWVRNTALRQALASLSPRDEIILILGATLVAGCFFTGQSVGYRGIDLIFVELGIIALRRDTTNRTARRLLLSLGITTAFLMWEGFFRSKIGGNWALFPFWLIRELLWWYLVSFLVAVLGLFAWTSTAATNFHLAAGRFLSPRLSRQR